MAAKVLERFKIGDLLEIIDGGGGSTGRIGDRGRVIDYSGNGDDVIHIKLTTGEFKDKVSGRFSWRYKKVDGDWDE